MGEVTRAPRLGATSSGGPKRRPVAVGVCCWAWLIVASATAYALDPDRLTEQYRFTRWVTENGLPHDHVNALAQTRDGYLWVGTAFGLTRYDGGGFAVYDGRNTPELGDGRISALLAARDGGLWVGTSRGLLLHEAGKFTRHGTDCALAGEQVTSMAESPAGGLWVGTLHGIFRLDEGRCHAFGTEGGLPHDYVLSVLADSSGKLWVGTWLGGLACWEDGAFVVQRRLGDDGIDVLAEAANGSLLVGTTADGLWRLDADGGERHWTSRDGLANDNVLSIVEDRDGNLWVGTPAGVQRLSEGRFDAQDPRVTGSVSALLEDHEGNLWLGSRSDGLGRLTDVSFVTYGEADGVPDGSVSAVLEDSRAGLWIATSKGLAHWCADGRRRVFTVADGLYDSAVVSLAEGEPQEIWVGTRRGVNRIRAGVVSRLPALDALGGPVWSLATDDDDTLWIGLLDGVRGYRQGMLVTATDPGWHPRSVASLLWPEGTGHGLFIGTLGGGLLYHDAAGVREAAVTARLPSKEVYALHRSHDGVLWIGTGGGLARLQGDDLTAYARTFYGGPIYRILEDDEGWLWCSSPHGVFRVERAGLDAVARDAESPLRYRLYGRADGLASSECSGGAQPSGWRGHDGRMWFPTLKGLAMVDPRNVVSNDVPPAVQIQKVVVDGQILPSDDVLRIPPGAIRLEFHYAGLSFRVPEQVRFRYRLEGFDDEWMSAAESRVAHYMNVPPGDYRFLVQAANSDGVWSLMPAGLAFSLKPRFYMTAWFVAVVVAAGLASAGTLYLRHRRGIEREFAAVLAERGRMARELHDTLAQGLAGISIQLEAVEETLRSDPRTARSHLDRARQLVRTNLADARRSVFNLRPRALVEGDLPEALARVVRDLTWGRSVGTELKVIGSPRPLPSRIEHNLLRIAQEATTNALQHAAARSIRIELRFDRYQVRVRLSDDGCGFDPDAVLRTQNEHLGLVGMRERAEELEGTLDVRSTPGNGTEVIVDVPVR